MNVKQLLSDEDAVSPVIGVILMVAITVILAAVIGTFVLGLGDQVQSSAPNTNFQFEYSNFGDGTDANDVISITHNGGQDVETDNLEVQVGSLTVWDAGTYGGTSIDANGGSTWSGTISTGDTIDIDEGGADDEFESNQDVRVIWTSSSGGSSNTIGSSTTPS